MRCKTESGIMPNGPIPVIPNANSSTQERPIALPRERQKVGGPGSATIVLMPRTDPDLQPWATPDFLMLSYQALDTGCTGMRPR